MATINVSLPSDGSTADVADYNTPITTIVNEINGALDNSNIAAAAGIAGSKLADGGIPNAKLASGAGEPNGAWNAWTPTLSGRFNDAKWIKECVYKQVGKTVFFKFKVNANAATPMDGSDQPVFTLPVTSVSLYDGVFLGTGYIEDLATASYIGNVAWVSTTTARITLTGVGGTYAVQSAISNTVPMTWASGDFIQILGFYEAA